MVGHPPPPLFESQDDRQNSGQDQAQRVSDLLHNLGNNLNCALLISDELFDLTNPEQVASLQRANELMAAHRHQLTLFLEHHPRGKLLPEFLVEVTQSLLKGQAEVQEQLVTLNQQLNEMRELILAFRAGEDPLGDS